MYKVVPNIEESVKFVTERGFAINLVLDIGTSVKATASIFTDKDGNIRAFTTQHRRDPNTGRLISRFHNVNQIGSKKFDIISGEEFTIGGDNRDEALENLQLFLTDNLDKIRTITPGAPAATVARQAVTVTERDVQEAAEKLS